MVTPASCDEEPCIHFITFSCYQKRRFLDNDGAKSIVVRVLNSQLIKQRGMCAGFVVMPDHVHALVWFAEPAELSVFIKQWKQRSSFNIKRLLAEGNPWASSLGNTAEPIWQGGYYDFKVFTAQKMAEKLRYIHQNPVRAGLAKTPADWRFSSARFYEKGEPVGVTITAGW